MVRSDGEDSGLRRLGGVDGAKKRLIAKPLGDKRYSSERERWTPKAGWKRKMEVVADGGGRNSGRGGGVKSLNRKGNDGTKTFLGSKRSHRGC